MLAKAAIDGESRLCVRAAVRGDGDPRMPEGKVEKLILPSLQLFPRLLLAGISADVLRMMVVQMARPFAGFVVSSLHNAALPTCSPCDVQDKATCVHHHVDIDNVQRDCCCG
eukprot:CAMPEP_0194515262 /NCGR_PEP_ID=MMETSP0253-20130528/47894_1 /TAXON_ID=2966 /ORGANISM="Noctiluca scintillans" /LENGTH=111 /DNA_ID=CAMNT_0039358997 /DNA_START=1109 /DNA_END=1441 /DNA_ORIENTATION=-